MMDQMDDDDFGVRSPDPSSGSATPWILAVIVTVCLPFALVTMAFQNVGNASGAGRDLAIMLATIGGFGSLGFWALLAYAARRRRGAVRTIGWLAFSASVTVGVACTLIAM